MKYTKGQKNQVIAYRGQSSKILLFVFKELTTTTVEYKSQLIILRFFTDSKLICTQHSLHTCIRVQTVPLLNFQQSSMAHPLHIKMSVSIRIITITEGVGCHYPLQNFFTLNISIKRRIHRLHCIPRCISIGLNKLELEI